ELLEPLIRLATEHLLDRALHTGLSGPEEPRQAPVPDEPQQLDLDVRLREPLPDAGVPERTLARRQLARLTEEPLEAPPDRPLERERPHRPALVREDPHRDLPSRTRRPDHHVGGDPHAVEEDLAELRIARHLHERADGDPGAPHVDEEQADAAVARRLGL